MRKGLWDRNETNDANCYNETYGEKLFWCSKKRFFDRIQRFFAAVLFKPMLIREECRFLLKQP